MRTAALLHDLGTIIAYDGRQALADADQVQRPAGFSPWEIALIGLLARCHPLWETERNALPLVEAFERKALGGRIAASGRLAARDRNVRVVLDPAPAAGIPADAFAAFDIVAPNQTETEYLVGVAVDDEGTAARAAGLLLNGGHLPR